MDVTHLIQVIILGLVEGLTEFLPVSSTGHLILMGKLLGYQEPSNVVFNIVIQFGAILAVCWVYRDRLWRAARGMVSPGEDRRFVLNVMLAVMPALIIGALFHDKIEALLESPMTVAVALIIGGIAILLIERRVTHPKYDRIENFPYGLSLAIGFMQCLAMIPGVSRSGATIMGALLLGVSRPIAAEFTFFLAVPTMAAASAYQLYKHHASLDFTNSMSIGIGFVVSYFSALLVVKGFVAFVGRHGFAPFAWYRILLGSVALGVLLLNFQ